MGSHLSLKVIKGGCMNRFQFMNMFKYVKSIVPTLKGVKFAVSDYFAFNYLDNYLVVSEEKSFMDELWEDFMTDYLKEEFDLKLNREQMDMFSLLHEIGHQQTIKQFSDKELNHHFLAVEELDDEDFYSYRKLIIEYEADKWAVDFIKEHKTELLELM
jgi:hypothetical protein